MNKDTVELLQQLYQIAHVQIALSKDDMTLDIDWSGLGPRIEKVLVREGIEIPERPEKEGE